MHKRTATLENGLEVSYKTKHILTTLIDSTTSHTYTQMFKDIAVLSIIAKSWKHPMPMGIQMDYTISI